jgi:hypothetical protein
MPEKACLSLPKYPWLKDKIIPLFSVVLPRENTTSIIEQKFV